MTHDEKQQIRLVRAPDAPAPNGHYSHAVEYGGVLYVSGQLGRGPNLSDAEAGDIVVQTRRALASLAAILHAGGSNVSRLLKVTLYIADVASWPAANAAYSEFLGEHRPARAVVAVGPLHFGALVEIDAIAAVGSR